MTDPKNPADMLDILRRLVSVNRGDAHVGMLEVDKGSKLSKLSALTTLCVSIADGPEDAFLLSTVLSNLLLPMTTFRPKSGATPAESVPILAKAVTDFLAELRHEGEAERASTPGAKADDPDGFKAAADAFAKLAGRPRRPEPTETHTSSTPLTDEERDRLYAALRQKPGRA